MRDTIHLHKPYPMQTTSRKYNYPQIAFIAAVILILAAGITALDIVTSDDKVVTESDTQSQNEVYWAQSTDDGSVAGVDTQRFVGPSSELQAQADLYDTFIGIGMNSMELFWYDNGHISHTFPILSVGDAVNKDSLPGQQYRVHYRNEKHLSSSANVYMPYTQQFNGNMSIHGQPETPGGDRATSSQQISNGIRLFTKDARRLYKLTGSDMPVIVSYNEAENEQALPNAPRVSATSFVVADIDTGEVITSKNGGLQLPIASITKLMTAVVSKENDQAEAAVYISSNAVATYGGAGGLRAGESFPLDTLYLPLLLDSSNDAATAIAEQYGYQNFIRLLNQKARIIGMRTTRFADPSGLSEKNVSTGHDLLRLARYIWSHHEDFLTTTTEIMMTTPDPYSDGLRNFTNNNPVVGMDEYLGGKNGYTDEARHTLLSLFSVESTDGDRNIAIIVLGSENRGDDTRKLLNWIKRVI